VDASDIRCRYIGKIIARDLRLVAGKLYRMAVTRPGSRAAVTQIVVNLPKSGKLCHCLSTSALSMGHHCQ
jgi:hypothetical protein